MNKDAEALPQPHHDGVVGRLLGEHGVGVFDLGISTRDSVITAVIRFM